MFTRVRKYLGGIFGRTLYWIGWGLAVLVIAQAIILSLTTGGPVVPLLLCGAGVILWLVGIGLKHLLAGQ
jgi:hypothetical protein